MGLGAIDYALHCDRKPGLLVVTDIDDARLERAASLLTVEDAKANGVELIYNFATQLTADALKNNFVDSDENGTLEVVKADKYGAYVGTGSELILRDKEGTEVARHTVVIFGDANGDGRIAGTDASKIKLWVKDRVKTTDEVAIADVDGNGRLQGQDVSALKAAVKKGGF